MDLFQYQKTGAEWLAGKRMALLADEMGLGKSAQAITAAELLRAKRICIICPAIARTNWLREFKLFAKRYHEFQMVFSKNIRPDLKSSTIISYDLATYFKSEDFGNYDVLICDELHYLKSIKTARTQKILGTKGWASHAKYVWGLSGTPAPNHAGELWPFLFVSGATKLNYDQFIGKFCNLVTTSYGEQITGTNLKATPELKKILAPVMLRRLAENELDLQRLFFHKLVIDPLSDAGLEVELLKDPDFAREQKLLMDTFGHLDMSNAQAMDALEGLASSLSTIRRYVGLKKSRSIGELVAEELGNNAYEKIVLFCVHTQVAEQLRARLKVFSPVVVTGKTSQNARQEGIDRFREDKSSRVFIGNIQAAGTAISLTAASQGIFVEQDWVPGNNAQAAKRMHRIGQRKPVFIRIASLANSFDENISVILMRKAKELSEIFDKNSLTSPFQIV